MARNPYAVLAVAGAATFMAVVDFTIVNVSLPKMASDLRLGEDSLQWVILGYGLPFGGLLLLAGRLGDIMGRRLVLQLGLVLFGAASLVAGLSTSSGQLIGARFAEGIGAAMMTPSALGLVADAFKQGKERETALGIYGALQGAAATVGVLAGGFLTDGPGWSWIFYVNIPIVVLLLAATVVVLPTNRVADPGGRFDPRSTLAVTGGLMAGLYALNHGVVHGWTTAATVSFGVAGVVLLMAFVAFERRSRIPLVPRAIIGNRPVVQANLAAAAGFGSFIAFVFLTSVVMQQVLGYSATKTGVAWLLTTVTAFIFAGLTGAVLAKRVQTRFLLGAASLLVVAAATWLVYLPAHTSFAWHVMPALVLAGVAVGLFAPSVGIGALTDVAEENFGGASGLVETSREFGGAVVIAAASTALLGSHTGLVHGAQNAYAVIAVGAAFGVLSAFVRRATTPTELPNQQLAPVPAGERG